MAERMDLEGLRPRRKHDRGDDELVADLQHGLLEVADVAPHVKPFDAVQREPNLLNPKYRRLA